jgi:hypothetical protein
MLTITVGLLSVVVCVLQLVSNIETSDRIGINRFIVIFVKN